MKKEEKSFYDMSKPRSIYKYELKATNEILTDTELCRSVLLATTYTNRNHLEKYTPHIHRTPSRLDYDTPYKLNRVPVVEYSLKEGENIRFSRLN